MKLVILTLVPVSLLAMATVAMAQVVEPANVLFADGAVAASLTGKSGDAAMGRKVFANRKQGNCLACHANIDLEEQPFHGEIGPPLDGVADRYEVAQLRGILVNSKMTFEDTIMPAFYSAVNGVRPLKKFEGKSILTAEQVEDVLAYLTTLKE
jgi:L-cysteine S-thiosulfotransferase